MTASYHQASTPDWATLLNVENMAGPPKSPYKSKQIPTKILTIRTCSNSGTHLAAKMAHTTLHRVEQETITALDPCPWPSKNHLLNCGHPVESCDNADCGSNCEQQCLDTIGFFQCPNCCEVKETKRWYLEGMQQLRHIIAMVGDVEIHFLDE